MLVVLFYLFTNSAFAHIGQLFKEIHDETNFLYIGYSTQSYCLDQIPISSLSLICPNNELIKLGRIIYGYSWSNDCSYIDKDCTMDVPREDIHCLTTNNCTVRVVEHPLILQDCWNLAATYVQAEYECIRGRIRTERDVCFCCSKNLDYSMENLCQSKDLLGKTGFLSTPNYPHGFASNLNCPCVLMASPGHSIILEIIDFHLPICAEAGLILWLGQDFQTKCLTQDPVTLISHFQQNITLRFYTFKSHQQGGVLMKYSVSPDSDNATVRLQCSAESSVQRSILANIKTSSMVNSVVEQTDSIDISINDNQDSSRSLRPTAFNQTIQKKSKSNLRFRFSCFSCLFFFAVDQSTNSSRSNVTLSAVFIITIVIFLIVINILIWFMCSAR